jgi:hypothetical protein
MSGHSVEPASTPCLFTRFSSAFRLLIGLMLRLVNTRFLFYLPFTEVADLRAMMPNFAFNRTCHGRRLWPGAGALRSFSGAGPKPPAASRRLTLR